MTSRVGKFTRILLIAAALVATVILATGPLFRLDILSFGTIFQLLTYATMVGAGVVILGIVALILDRRARRGIGAALLAILVAGVPTLLMANNARTAQALPYIHDITTDTANPPAFVAALPLRADAPNPPEYDPEVAAKQRAGYPDLGTQRLALSPETAFAEALDAVRDEGLEVIAEVPDEGRIEAVATTAFFGFKDDVVIRVRPDDGDGALVDIRSKSRMGQSDVGANAARIRALQEEIAD
ncbi:MAG: DUF1499 domain-containing protein [Pseudomonadota bacterium]